MRQKVVTTLLNCPNPDIQLQDTELTSLYVHICACICLCMCALMGERCGKKLRGLLTELPMCAMASLARSLRVGNVLTAKALTI